MDIPLPNDILFVEKWIYDWGLLLENAIGSWYTGRYDEFFNRCKELLSKPDFPKDFQEMVENSLKSAVSSLRADVYSESRHERMPTCTARERETSRKK